MEKVEKKYYYSEIFHSIQGEGHYTGVPTAWIRFFLCNLQCNGFGQKDPTNPDTYELPFEDFDISTVKRVEDLPKHDDSGANLITIDGVRLETENFWFLLRASNTQNCIVFRLEHFIENKFKEELTKLISILESYSLDIKELTSFNQTV